MRGNTTKPPEASTLSKSLSVSVDAAERKNLIQGKSSLIDNVFPLCDEMLKDTRIAPFLYNIMIILVCLQILSVSFWLQFDYQARLDTPIGNVLKYFFMIAFFSKLEQDDAALTIGFVLFTTITVIYFGMLIIQGVIYNKNRRFIKWTLYITRFFIEFIPSLFCIPLGYFIGQNFDHMLSETTTLSIVYFVFNMIYLCAFIFAHYLMSYLFGASTYISTSPNACWSGTFHFVFIIGVGLFTLFGWVLKYFQGWLQPVLLIGKLVFDFFIEYNTTFLPFVHFHSNTLVATLFSVSIVLDILCFIQYFGIEISYMYHIILIFVVAIGGFFIWRYVTNSIVRKVKQNLSLEALEDIVATEDARVTQNISSDQYMVLQDAPRRQLFLNYRLHRSSYKCQLYMRIGISNNCPLFLDWSLSKFIAEFHNTEEMISLITQYLSYFPCESRLLNYFFYNTISKPKLKIGQRFMIYQVHRVKGLRQSAASSEITEKLMEMKQHSMRGINSVRSYWETVPRNPSLLYDIRVATTKSVSLYKEAIDKWPNNCRLCEDYSIYLIECATDFTEGLKIKHRAELIEQGKNFVVDLSFRSLVRAYPQYLKKNIMDLKGNFQKSGASLSRSGNNSTSNSQNSQISTGTMDGELDLEIEEQLAKNAFSYHRLRLAYQRALECRKSSNNTHLKYFSIFCVLFAIGLIIFLYAWFFSLFTPRAQNMDRQLLLNRFRYGFDAALASVITHWANKNGLISNELLGNATIGLAMRSPKTNNNNLQFSSFTHKLPDGLSMSQNDYNMIDEISRWVMFSRDNLNDFMSQVILLASQGNDVKTIMTVMLERTVKIDFCDFNTSINGMVQINQPVNQTLKTALTYGLIKIGNVTQVQYADASDWNVNKGLCENFVNIEAMFEAFNELTFSISKDQQSQKDSTTTQNYIILGALCIGYNIICMPVLLILLTKTLSELRKLMTMMSEIDKQSRDDAAKPFKSTLGDEESLKETWNENSISPLLLYSIVVFYCLFVAAIFILIIMISEEKNENFLELNQWLFYGISRGNYMLECIVFAILNVFVSRQPDLVRYITKERTFELTREILCTLMDYNNNLLRGKDATNGQSYLPACIGQNERLDNLNFADDCHGNLNMGGFHDTYRCASLDRGITLFNVLIHEIIDDPLNVSLELDKQFYHAFHLMNDHLMDPSYEAAAILASLASDSIDMFHTLISAIAFGGIAILVFVFILFYICLGRLDTAFDGALQLLRRLPPLSVITNQDLLNYLLNKKQEKTAGKMTSSQSIILNSKDAVLCLNRGESIEVVNKSVSALFGYTPEQLLGQPLSSILQAENNPKIYEQTNYMRNGESPLTFETNSYGISDDEQSIPVHVTVLGIAEQGGKCAESFVIIMRDESLLLKQRHEAEEAKKTSETLLYQILPRDIVVRLNHGETDISFVVASATVIFIDIVKFSEYSANLTPAQIMENLSMVFASFDSLCNKYNLITKIKLIGDVYMAAANLFTPDEQASNHASQVVQFGLDVLQALEEINTQLDSSLQVRIGVNTDGPLIAGVLGTDKPVFDIIGDPINVAARLQSNGIPGTVQISQSTYDSIIGQNFNIEQRGEIVLKGKGKKMAYIVRPSEQSSFFMNPDLIPSVSVL